MKTINLWMGSLCLVLGLSLPAMGQNIIVEKSEDGSKKEIRIIKKKIKDGDKDMLVEIIKDGDHVNIIEGDAGSENHENVWVFKEEHDPQEIKIIKKKLKDGEEDVLVEIIRDGDHVNIIKDIEGDASSENHEKVWVFKGASDSKFEFEFKEGEFPNEDFIEANVEIKESSRNMKSSLEEVDKQLEEGAISAEEAAKKKSEITLRAAEEIINAAEKIEGHSSSKDQ